MSILDQLKNLLGATSTQQPAPIAEEDDCECCKEESCNCEGESCSCGKNDQECSCGNSGECSCGGQCGCGHDHDEVEEVQPSSAPQA